MLEEPFDEYFKIDDWYLENSGSSLLESATADSLNDDSGD
jgi:hypothetical protein